MEATTNQIEVTDTMVNNAMANFCPFGWLDIQTAVSVSLACGETTSFPYECVSEFVDSVGGKIEDYDPVACVYDAILQTARGEIEGLTGYDFLNDFRGDTEIYTAGNFMCTSYDYSEEAIKDLTEKLREGSVIIEDCSRKLKWFLDQLEITQEKINAA